MIRDIIEFSTQPMTLGLFLMAFITIRAQISLIRIKQGYHKSLHLNKGLYLALVTAEESLIHVDFMEGFPDEHNNTYDHSCMSSAENLVAECGFIVDGRIDRKVPLDLLLERMQALPTARVEQTVRSIQESYKE